MKSPEKIEKTKLILAEGKDAELFLVWASSAYRPQKDVQVMNFGGNNELPNYVLLLTHQEKFDEVETLVIARDAETNTESAIKSVQDCMNRAKLPVPEKPFDYVSQGIPRTAFMIFPGPENDHGTLEDLCLLTVEEDPVMTCVDEFLECTKTIGEKLPRLHKNRLHCFLAGKNKYVGSNIGLASKQGAWNPSHEALNPFKTIIQDM